MIDVQQMVLSMWMMTSHLMGMTASSVEEEADQVNRLIRIFLTKVFDYDQNTAKDLHRKSPMWKSAYNFLCPLNLPEQIKNLGPIRNRWEGSIRGECFIQQVKPNINSTRRTNWQKNLMNNLLQQRELLILKSATLNENGNPEQKNDTNGYSTYHSVVDIVADFNDQVPISCILTETEIYPEVYVVLMQNRQRWAMKLFVADGVPSKYCFGMWYHPFQTTPSVAALQPDLLRKLEELEIKAYALLLPMPSRRTQQADAAHLYYTMVDSRWRAMAEDGRMVLPRQFLVREFDALTVSE